MSDAQREFLEFVGAIVWMALLTWVLYAEALWMAAKG